MCATFEERQFYIGMPTKKDADRAAARDRKAERNAKIIDLHRKGYSQHQIAAELQCGRATVQRILGAEK